MTNPTITYGHGWLTDCDDTTGWSGVQSNMVDGALTILINDIFQLSGSCDEAADEYLYYEKDIVNFSSDVYPQFILRWKTSAGSNSLGAKVELVFTDASTQKILGATQPQFSTTWTVTTGTITAGKTVDKIRFFADDYPDSLGDSGSTGTLYVYYDFLLFCKGIFTFPHVAPGGVKVDFPRKDVELDIWGRDGGIIQKGGMKSPIITVTGDMEHRTDNAWGTSNYPYGEYLLKIIRDTDPFQWFTSDVINCKVTPTNDPLSIFQASDSRGAQRLWELRLKQYSLSSLGESTWDDRAWHGF